MRSRLIALALAAMTAELSLPARAAELSIVIDKLRSARGSVHLALWNRAEDFTDPDAALVRTNLPAADGQVRFDLGELAPGRYAIAAFHDENGNGSFDRTWIGLPDEGLGFSNGAWIGLGAPSFKEAAFEVLPSTPRSKAQVVVVGLRYPGGELPGGEATDRRARPDY